MIAVVLLGSANIALACGIVGLTRRLVAAERRIRRVEDQIDVLL